MRENASDQGAIGFSSASDWSKRWREFSGPIGEQRRSKPWQPGLLSKINFKNCSIGMIHVFKNCEFRKKLTFIIDNF